MCPACIKQAGLGATRSEKTEAAEEGTVIVTPNSAAADETVMRTELDGSGPVVGTRVKYLGDYELLSEIARGGMGVVYRARQTSLNRTVALKMILAGQLAGEEEVQRFHTEAEAAANLDHPGIVPIYEVGEVDGQHYFSMGYVDGPSLAELIAENPFEPREAARLMLKIAEAIAYAHQQGVIHRDLKPANVLLQRRSTGSGSSSHVFISTGVDSQSSIELSPRVTDFGLAKQVQGNDQLTASGQILGTPSYMPPEQAAGKTDEIDDRADIYSLGGILCALMTGHPPFQAANALDTLMQVLEKDPLPPRQLNPKLPRDLETIALRALEKDPRRRYQSATEFAEDLARFLSGEPIKARSITRVERDLRWAKRKPVIAGLGTLAAVLLLVITVGGPLVAIQQAKLRMTAEDNEVAAKRAQRNAERSATAEAVAKRMAEAAADAALASEKRERVERQRAENALYLSDIRLAAAYLQAERHADAQERLLQHVPDSTQNDRRGWEWYHLTGRSDPSLVRWNTNSRNVQAITWSPDGKQLAAAQWGGPSAMIWNAADGSDDRSLIGGKTLTEGIDWHPKTNQVAWGCAGNDFQLRILDLNDNSMTLLKEDTGSHRCVRWSPGGKRIALGGIFGGDSDKTVVIWENQNGKWQTLSKVRTEGGSGVDSVAWSPSGTELLVVGRYSDSWVMNPENLKVLRKTSEYGICSAGWHPTLPLIVCGLRSGEICILNSETMEVQKRVNAHLGEITSIAWSADGTFLASGSADQSVKIWDGATLEAISSFVGHRGIVNEVRWSPDGTRLASCGFDGRISIWPQHPKQSSIALEVEKNLENRSIRNRRRFAWLDNDTIRASISDREIVHRDAKTGQVKSKIDLKGGGWQVLASNQIYRFFDSDAIQITTDAKDATSEAVVRPTRNLWTNLYSDKWVAYCEQPPESYSADGPFYAQNLETHLRIRLGEQSFTMVGEVQWSPDQKWIAVVGGGVMSDGGNLRHAGWVNLCDAKTGKTSHRVRIGEQRVTGLSVAWRPDSKCLVAGNRDGLCQVYETPNLKTKFSKRMHRLAVQSLSWHPTQDRVASGSLDRTVSIWDANTGDVFVTFTLDAPIEHVCWSPNGVRVAAMDINGKIYVWDATDGGDLPSVVLNQTSGTSKHGPPPGTS